MPFILDSDGYFESRESTEVNGGYGVFCSKNILGGTVLPYFAIGRKVSEMEDDYDCTYCISAEFTDENGKVKSLRNVIMDGNPSLPEIQEHPMFLRMASLTNEATKNPPNAILLNNPCVTKDDIKNSLIENQPIPVMYLVVPFSLEEGTELFTLYGDDYGKRSYKKWRIKRKIFDRIFDASCEITETFKG